MGFGRQLLGTIGRSDRAGTGAGQLIAKDFGGTIDWGTVAVVNANADTTWGDNFVVPAGKKALRRGQILCAITAAAADVVTISGSPTGGTFTITVSVGGVAQTTTALAYNAAASAVQTALQALTNVGSGNATVTGSAGGPYTITFGATLSLQPIVVTASAAGLTGGTPAIAVSQTAGGNVGYYGPFDPAATDGRQTLTRGQVFFLDESWTQDDIGADNPAMYFGGEVFQARMIVTTGTHSLAAGPTWTELWAVMPRLDVLVEDLANA